MSGTPPVAEPTVAEESLKLRLLLPHFALASFLVLLAIASFIHYHKVNKTSKADAKFTEELNARLKRPRAAQGFPSTLARYFGFEVLNTPHFTITHHLLPARRVDPEQGGYSDDHGRWQGLFAGQDWPEVPVVPARLHIAPAAESQQLRPVPVPTEFQCAERNGGFTVFPLNPVDEFRDYYQRPELHMSPMSLLGSSMSEHARDAGSFLTTTPSLSNKTEPTSSITRTTLMGPRRKNYRLAR